MRTHVMSSYSAPDQRLIRLASTASLGCAVLITTMKLVAWLLSDSLSLLASLVDSCLDIITSLINFFAVRYALLPPDDDHRFGHQKAEDLAAFTQAAFILASGIFITSSAVKRFFYPHPPEQLDIAMLVMVVSTVITCGLVAFQRYVIMKTRSSIIKADSLHYVTDLLMNVTVIGSLYASMRFQVHMLDPLLAIVIAVYIVSGAWHIAQEAFHHLMDREFEDSEREKLIQLVLTHPDAKGVHDMRTRLAGSKLFIQFHLELDSTLTLARVHEISDEIEATLLTHFPNADILIHQDPWPYMQESADRVVRTGEK